MSLAFDVQYQMGQLGESAIARWLNARGQSVLPAYEIEIQTGKGPRLFTPAGPRVAPDMFTLPSMTWVEAKHKSHFTWHRKTEQWCTGIDLHHYEEYQRAGEDTSCPVWLLFLHANASPDPRDLNAGSPAECPTGLFGGDLSRLSQCESHRHRNWGRYGMVYWRIGDLTKLANLEDLPA